MGLTALEVYTPPFKLYSGIKIFHSGRAGGGMALDFLVHMNDKDQQRIVDILNGNSKEFAKKEITHDGAGTILSDGKEILLVRGWGYLIGVGGLHLPPEEAARIQDEFTEWVVLRLQGKV